MLNRLPALDFKIDGNLIHIEQDAGHGANQIDLHRLHVAHLAKLLNIQGSAHARLQYPQERALLRLWSKLEILTAECFLGEIVERCGDGLLIQAHVFDARNILSDILEDFGLEVPQDDEPTEAARAASNGNSPRNDMSGEAGITVTQSRRGRPATGAAMTNAERQARFRAKQADLLTDVQAGAAHESA